GEGSTPGQPGVLGGAAFPFASPRFQIQPKPKLYVCTIQLEQQYTRGAPLGLRPSGSYSNTTSRENCFYASIPPSVDHPPATSSEFCASSREEKKKIARRKQKRTPCSLLARLVSRHLPLAPAVCVRGHRDAKPAAWTSADHALTGGTFCRRHSGVLQATRIFHTGQPRLAPLPPLPEYGGKVRLGLIPEEFFQFLYPKTGVTGPYMLGTGLILYFLSKEIYVITPETFSTISIVGLLVYVIKKYGASIGEFIDNLNEQKIAQLEEVKQASIKQIQDAIELEKAQQALVQKRHYLFDVQRNNIAMALEVTYRERLHKVYKEVKNRLDYHISVQNMMHRKEQEHMINWVEKHVVQSISAQQEKETIAKCIADLQLLAKKAQAQPVM
uniref:ATP synthase subunit b n=1 Tax=Sciurus vulgaris TaxID=55149 RepID=A0A8D2DB92_SCIVU